MIKARVWILDDEDPRVDKVLGHFDMKPSEEWNTGTQFGEVKNYKFTVTVSKFIPDNERIEITTS